MRNANTSRRNEYALITGASSGIGHELAKVFARNGFNLILVARNLEKLEAVARELAQDCAIDCQVISADLALMSNVEQVHRTVSERKLTVSVLVNDAGIGAYGLFQEGDFRTEAQVINLNVMGLTYLTKLFSKDMVANGSGRILNVASVVGFWPVPRMAVYAATKAYVISFSQSLASELQGTGVRVSALCPGAVETGFLKNGVTESKSPPARSVFRILGQMRQTDVKTVAAEGYSGLMRNRRIIVPSTFFRLFRFAMKFLPQGLVSDLREKSRRKHPPGKS